MAGGGHTRGHEHVLHPRLGALEPGPRGRRPEREPAPGGDGVDHTVDQGLLGSDHDEVDVTGVGEVGDRSGVVGHDRHALRELGHAGVSRSAEHLVDRGGADEAVGQRMLASAPADDERSHRSSTTVCSRPGPTPTNETGTPASSWMRITYARASAGRSSSRVAWSISPCQPGRVS